VRARCARILCSVAAAWLGCGGGAWDLAALEARHPALAAAGAHPLGDATPYLLPRGGELTLFLCRWERARPLRVSLPPDASPRERRLLGHSLRAWREALPGVAFERVEGAGEADIEMRFETPDPERTAATAAECAVHLEAQGDETQLAAQLVAARVALRRANRDWRGREIILSDAELLGSALHEMGHALGFQGHARRGATVMLRSVDEVRFTARRLLSGAPFADAALAALYRVPSGSVVARIELSAEHTAPLDRLEAIARRIRLSGPLVRVGDRSALIAWRGASDVDYGFFVPRVHEVLRDPQRMILVPTASIAALRAGPSAP